MEELLVYALLLYEGFDVEDSYMNYLDTIFLENPTNDILLELEHMSKDIKASIVYIRTHFDYNNFNHDRFGKFLMQHLQVYYEKTELGVFAYKMFSLWESLPGIIQEEPPFSALCYADNPLSWGDEKQPRMIYERMLHYYDV